jgi:hypothetical protein
MAAGNGSGMRSGASRYDYVVDISPSGGDPPFTTTMTTPMFIGHWRVLHVGHVVTVLHKPGTEAVKWDRREKTTSRRYARKAAATFLKHSGDKEFEAALRASRARGHTPAHGGIDPKVAELIEFEEQAQAEEGQGREDRWRDS